MSQQSVFPFKTDRHEKISSRNNPQLTETTVNSNISCADKKGTRPVSHNNKQGVKVLSKNGLNTKVRYIKGSYISNYNSSNKKVVSKGGNSSSSNKKEKSLNVHILPEVDTEELNPINL